MTNPLEKDIEKVVCDYAKKLGVLTYKFTSPGHTGVPDRIFMFPNGCLVFIEFKRAGGALTPMQVREIARMQACGQSVSIVSSIKQGLQLVDDYVAVN